MGLGFRVQGLGFRGKGHIGIMEKKMEAIL